MISGKNYKEISDCENSNYIDEITERGAFAFMPK